MGRLVGEVKLTLPDCVGCMAYLREIWLCTHTSSFMVIIIVYSRLRRWKYR